VHDLAYIIRRNVRAERARRSWRQADLAEQMGWTTAVVSDLETGRRNVWATDLPRLCAAFDISLAKLLDGADKDDLRHLRLG
jgi:transcriptional regulator with XRE-family HTH domain